MDMITVRIHPDAKLVKTTAAQKGKNFLILMNPDRSGVVVRSRHVWFPVGYWSTNWVKLWKEIRFKH